MGPLAVRNTRLLDASGGVIEESSDGLGWRFLSFPNHVARIMVTDDIRREWSRENAMHAAWMHERPDSLAARPRVNVSVFPVLVGAMPYVSIVAIEAGVLKAAVPHDERARLLADATADGDFAHAPLSVSIVGNWMESTSALRLTSRDRLAWVIGRDATPINPSDPDTMRVRTDWGWLVASFDEDGALRVEGVAELSDASRE